jgi:anti-anti-sigma factor
MDFTQSNTADGLVVSLRGSFTFKDHHAFRAIIDALSVGGGRKYLDLAQVEFIDSAALGMLMIAEEETSRANGALVLRNLSPQIAGLFELSAMSTVFTIE